MTQRPIEEPTIDPHGAEVHPAFGMISASRVSHGGGPGAGAVLFQSDIKHGNTIRITVNRATRSRDLNHDWVHPSNRDLIEVEMSEAQWASFVSSMNTSGVPCTVRRTETDWRIPELPYQPRLAESMGEVKNAAVQAFGGIREAMAAYEKAIEDKAGAKIIKEKLRNLHSAIENSGANMHFAAKSLVEHTENVVQRARADIEAMVAQEVERRGLEAGQTPVLELPVLAGEVIEDAEIIEPLSVDPTPSEAGK
jgi:hypothetical protein